jgi:hypothetical protein
MTILTTAFQIGAFQFNAFQEAQTVGSGGWIPFWFLMREYERKRRLMRELKRKKKKKEEVEQEEVVAAAETVTLRFVPITARRREIDLAKYLRAIIARPVIDEEAELREFYELMEIVAKMDEVM